MSTAPQKPKLELGVLETAEHECPKHGKYSSDRRRLFGWSPCEPCLAEAEEAERRAKEAAEYESRMKRANIPLRFQRKSFANYTASTDGQQRALMMCRAYVDHFAENLELGRCMVLVGEPGTGKTHLALAIAQDLLGKGFAVRYTTVHELIEQIRETWRNDSTECESAVIKRFTSPHLLILDEVGVQYGKPSEQVEFFKVLNARYNDLRPTIVLSNVTIEEVKLFLGERTFDRLRENEGKVVTFPWESERGK